jgi:transposase
VPGRKTDHKDSEWIADLLQHGLLRASFVPPIRELRDLTRYRASLAQEINRIANRIQKVLEDANIKLASVATDTLVLPAGRCWKQSSMVSKIASAWRRCREGCIRGGNP